MVKIDCICPPLAGETRHPEGDTVTLRPVLDFRTAATIQHAVSVLRLEEQEPNVEEVLARLTEAYVRYGVESWTIVDADGKAVPVTPSNVEAILFADLTAAMIVGEEADELYSGAILLPLLKRASTFSPDTQTTDETSQPTGSQETPAEPTPLRPSSTSTTQTDDTVTTSSLPDGDSRSSLNMASAV
jgi:hypothetical protein